MATSQDKTPKSITVSAPVGREYPELHVITFQNESSGAVGPAEAYTKKETADERCEELNAKKNGNEYFVDSVAIIE